MAVLNDCTCQHVGYCDGSCQHPNPMSGLDAKALAPCPFCGGSTVIVEKTIYGYGHTVSCDDCTAMVVSTAEPPIDSERDAVAIWNSRAALPQAGKVSEAIVAPAECDESCDDPDCPYSHKPLTLRQAYENTLVRLRAAEAALSSQQAEAVTVAFQDRVQPWMMACFGPEISADRVERGDRLLEEVFELLQSGCYDPARVLSLRDYVWGREIGEPAQEVGGVMVTLAAYCLAHDLDMHQAGETELARIWTKVEKIREKQAAKPKHSPLPVASSPSPADAGEQAVKALQWIGAEGAPGADIHAEPTPFMKYSVRHLGEGKFDVILNTDTGSLWFRAARGETHGTYDEAKAAAQADFNARRSALVPATSQAKGGAEVDVETAARAVLADWDDRMNGEREELKTESSTGHEYWSPRASMVSSSAIADLRSALRSSSPVGQETAKEGGE